MAPNAPTERDDGWLTERGAHEGDRQITVSPGCDNGGDSRSRACDRVVAEWRLRANRGRGLRNVPSHVLILGFFRDAQHINVGNRAAGNTSGNGGRQDGHAQRSRLAGHERLNHNPPRP
ncbi:MAG: hypothetical protein AAF805_13770 [Planctomycetota bacterium]